jgi:hypothetical protein
VIWSHRRRGDHRFLAAARYDRRAQLTAQRVLLGLKAGSWRRRNRRFLQPSAYARKLRRAVGALRAR